MEIEKEFKNLIDNAKVEVERSWNIDDGRTWELHKIKTNDYLPLAVYEFQNGKGNVYCSLKAITGVDYKGEIVYHQILAGSVN